MRRVVLVGVGDGTVRAFRELRSQGKRCVGIYSTESMYKGRRFHNFPIYTGSDGLEKLLDRKRADEIQVIDPAPDDAWMLQLFEWALAKGCAVTYWCDREETAGRGARYQPLTVLLENQSSTSSHSTGE